MSVVSLTRPTQQQLSEVETAVDAYEAFLNALWWLKIPNYLVLQHELAAPGFTFSVAGLPTTNLDGALSYIAQWHASTQNLGRCHRTAELAYSTSGTRIACLDYQTVTLTSPVRLPTGTVIKLLPGQSARTLHLRSAHYLRLTGHQIVEWRISSTLKNFLTLLD